MIETISAAEIRGAMEEAERICQAQRQCKLLWTEGATEMEVLAREDIPSRELMMEPGLATERRLTEFVVVRTDLEVAPPLDTVFEIEDRADRWRLKQVDSGDSPNDPVWTFVCCEEFS